MSSLGNFVWSIANQLRGVYRPHQYGSVTLPVTILRRLDCLLAGTREEVRLLATANANPNVLAARVRQQMGLGFDNTSEFDLARLVADLTRSRTPRWATSSRS